MTLSSVGPVAAQHLKTNASITLATAPSDLHAETRRVHLLMSHSSPPRLSLVTSSLLTRSLTKSLFVYLPSPERTIPGMLTLVAVRIYCH
ncbi:unnamed protein product [Brassica rapa]|uniref:Uncharacterized protein n=1 Tax=Brassica campestris TaxID=3711 RepID=A0A3P5ZSV1_BRACM|nr:unnamed protein product [Brassica rapa]VDC77733.1 unnamed protein product [Brassica rapa]